MVMVGQQRRLAQPLRWGRRERWAVGVAGALALAGVAALILALALGGSSNKGCVQASFASTTGGTIVRYCGARARAVCRQVTPAAADSATQALLDGCRRAGYATAPG